MQLLPVHRVIGTACIAAHRAIVMDVIAVTMIQHEVQVIAQRDFQLHAITVIDSLMHHGTRHDSIIDSRSPPENTPEIRAAHATQILATSESSHAQTVTLAVIPIMNIAMLAVIVMIRMLA
jgi:hypothetical protein